MLLLGILLVLFTVGVAVAIGYRANESVRRFNEAKYESFLGDNGKT
jgi:hypothetical protein